MVKHIHQIVADDFATLNQKVVDLLHSEVTLIENIGHYIIEAGGKRMRPVLVLLCFHASIFDKDNQEQSNDALANKQHVDLATVIEFLHTATLLHDDVVDMSEMRRGRPTANIRWDNPSSVLVGDFIYSRAFQLLVSLGNMAIMDVMATTTNKISEGEVLQLVNQRNPATSEADYMTVIRNKTAILFAAACKSAAILSGASLEVQNQLNDFGMAVGIAFQLIDDVLDYSGNSTELGKNVGDDLAEGKPTLPLIYTMQNGSEEHKLLIEAAIRHGGLEKLQEIISAVKESGALEYTRQRAEEQIAAALQCLTLIPDSKYKDGLRKVAEAALNRTT